MFEKNGAKIHFGSKAAYVPLLACLALVENEQRLRQTARGIKKMMVRR